MPAPWFGWTATESSRRPSRPPPTQPASSPRPRSGSGSSHRFRRSDDTRPRFRPPSSGRWAVSEHRVICADCLGPEGLATLADKSVDHVITDPPYEAEAHTLQRRVKVDRSQAAGKESSTVIAAPLDFAPITAEGRRAAAAHFARVARRWIIVFCQAEAVQAWREALEAGGAVYKRACVWVKPDAQPQLTGDRPGMGYESIVVAHAPGRSRWNGGGRVGVYVEN